MDSTRKRKTKETAAHDVKLPWELIEEILSRVPPESLVRFRIVCKQWNALFDDKTFINNHKSTFRFILKTKHKIYSVSIDPEIVVHELTLDIPGLESEIPKNVVECDEFLLCDMTKGAAVWNPWLNRTRWIETDVSHTTFRIDSLGYDNKRVEEKIYKTIWHRDQHLTSEWTIHNLTSDAWKDLKVSGGSNQGKEGPKSYSTSAVSLNGILYWVVFYDKTDPLYHLYNFDFSRERFTKFCELPCGMNHPCDALVLRVYKGDRFSLLKQCYSTKKTEIWVTKNKINYEDGDDVVWMNFMTLSIPNFPSLVEARRSQPSYFIDDKRLVVCSCDKSGKAWIYVVGENKLISKTQIDSEVDPWPSHCTYFPSLVPVPHSQRNEAELQV